MRLALATVPPDSGAYDYEPVSADSQAVSRRWADARNFLRWTASDWTPPVQAALREMRESAMSANWDGLGAEPVSDSALALAESVVAELYALLPKGTPAPDIFPETDGEICLTWSVDGDRVFSVSLGDHGNANYAGQFGRSGGVHGWQPLATDSRVALEGSLREIAEHVDKVFRVAARQRSG